MLNRSRSWPVQSVVTLDPRGIVRSKVQSPFDAKKNINKIINGYNKVAFTIATPDLVLEANANERFPFHTKPDIFFSLEPKRRKEKQSEPMQVHFVDHYQVLDSDPFGKRPREFVVNVPTDENELSLLNYDQCNVPTEQVPLKRSKSIPKNEEGALKPSHILRNKNRTSCELCKCNGSYSKYPSPILKTEEKETLKFFNDAESLNSPKKNEESSDSGINQFLSSYQIDILRKNCMKSGKERRESSFDLNNSFDKDSLTKRKPFERKLTAEFESVASNETKTTDCDEKSAHKRSFKRDHKANQSQLIRSYSLGHERTRNKLNGTFKKFSLPTPISQLKDGNDNPENAHEGSASLPRNVNLDARKVTTLTRHYYPEGGWGYVIVTCSVMVHILCHGLQLSSGVIMLPAAVKFKTDAVHTGWLGALSTAVALLLSPITIAFCRRKSTRVTAVVGGLITALGCLFTSFASQFHQLFFSYGTVIGVGVGLTRDCSTLMVAQYFKRRRELVEIFIVSGSGLGISVMSACIQGAINAIGWRLGLQAVTGAVFLTFILGTFYRSASLYHPQRRAILHLKNQKRKIKDKNKVEDRPAFLDTSTLRSKTVRILLASTGLSAFGINTPIFYLARQAEEEGLGERAVLLQAYLGLAWVLGCAAFGLVVVHNSVECRIARQYLCQAAVLMCGLSILALTAVHGNYHGYVLFVWIYGIFCGGYHYSLKMYTYERVRARNFARTWGFVQCSQAIPIALGVPISGYMNEECGGKAGYYFSSTCTLAGSVAMFLIDVHRRRIARHKHTKANGQRHLCESDSCPRRRPSIGAEPEPEPQISELPVAELIQGAPGEKPELTCISEEGIADMDLPDNLLDDLDYIGITSCNKVENYLMLSEFENNLIAEAPVVLDKRGRRWSLARRSEDAAEDGGRWRLVAPKRTITVIDEASV